MPFTLIASSESQDSATLTGIAGLADPHMPPNGDFFTIPADLPFLAMAYALGPNADQVEIDSPNLMNRIPLNLDPLDNNAEPTPPLPLHNWQSQPLALKAGDTIRASMAEDGAGATRVTCAMWLSSGPLTPVKNKDQLTIRATNTSTLTANAWTNGALTLDDTLEAGSYQVIGMRAESAGLQLARLVFANQGPRPGCIGFDADGDTDRFEFRNGNLGVWGTFTDKTVPTVDFLSISADTSQEVWLDLIKSG